VLRGWSGFAGFLRIRKSRVLDVRHLIDVYISVVVSRLMPALVTITIILPDE
jgi:hypothetical protein